MSKDPAVLLYTSDFLTGTMFMTDEEVGQYIRLLCAQHQRGRLTEKEILSIIKSYDSQVMEKIVKDKTGKYYNKRMETEIYKRENYCNSRSHKGLSGRKKKNHTKIVRESYENRTENENDNKDVFNSFRTKYKGTKRGNNTEFADFKKHKDWKMVLPLLEDAFNKQVEYRKYLKSKRKFCPEWKNLKTWLHNRCWEEETTIPEEVHYDFN